MTDIDKLEQRLAGLRGERDSLSALLSREDLCQTVEEWVAVRRVHYAGSCRFALGGGFEQDAAVLTEDRFADEGLPGRIVARLEALGFGEVTAKAKTVRLRKLEEQIAQATADLREARKAAALAQVEAEFAAVSGEAA